jgi:hypothetical protein
LAGLSLNSSARLEAWHHNGYRPRPRPDEDDLLSSSFSLAGALDSDEPERPRDSLERLPSEDPELRLLRDSASLPRERGGVLPLLSLRDEDRPPLIAGLLGSDTRGAADSPPREDRGTDDAPLRSRPDGATSPRLGTSTGGLSRVSAESRVRAAVLGFVSCRGPATAGSRGLRIVGGVDGFSVTAGAPSSPTDARPERSRPPPLRGCVSRPEPPPRG